MKLYNISLAAALVAVAFFFVPSNALASKEHVKASAIRHGVPIDLALYVAKLESGYRCTTPGRYNGPLQISNGSARALGYKKSEGPLNSCGAGLKYGMIHLKLCFNKVGHNKNKLKRCHASPGSYGVRLKRR